MNFVKKSLVGEIKGRVGALGRVKALERIGALLLLAFDFFVRLWGLASSSCSLVGSARGLLQGLRQARDPGAIAIEI